jgi:UDP-N-acetylmuramate: L-alanyl-gamma-D-glutamyl-meso-diaminopimelate ligase
MDISSLGGIKNIYFLGIAGQLMSALACVTKNFGYNVTGSDENAYPPATNYLQQHQITYIEGHNPSNIQQPDLVVLGNHIRPGNAELDYILTNKIPFVSYPQMVNLLFPKAKYRLVIAGTHGKSTTTSLVGWILTQAKLNPTVLIGAKSNNFNSSYRIGSPELLVIEGDEYTSSCLDSTSKFLYYHPTHAVITSIELDHMDVFKTWENQLDTFIKFSKSVRSNGLLLLCGDTIHEQKSQLTTPSKVEEYGLGPFDWQATILDSDSSGTKFEVKYKNASIGTFHSPLSGTHYLQDVLSAIAITKSIGVSETTIDKAISTFAGVGQRFEIISAHNSITIVSDYAHHPTAIAATISAAKSRFPTNRIICVYEPHTYTRIKGLLPEFTHAFDGADKVIIADIMAAREKSLSGLVHATDIVKSASLHPDIQYIGNPDNILEYLKTQVKKNDVIVVMAVGKFGSLPQKLSEYSKSLNI